MKTRAPTFDADSYASWFETELGRIVWEDERATLRRLLGTVQRQRILDGGVGEGRLALELMREGARVTGVDLAPDMLRLAQRRAAEADSRLPLAAGRLEALPFRSESFDLVVAVTVLCFVPEPIRAVREMARVLRPGGRIVLGELGRWSFWAAKRRVKGWFGDSLWRNARFWTPAALERLVRDVGLEPVDRGAAVFYPPSALAARLLRSLDRRLSGGGSALGAAFVAVAAEKR